MARKQGGLRFQPSGGQRTPAVPVGKKQLLDIARLAADGRGIAFADGRTWFVSGALAGEQVEARVLAAHGKVVDARTERVLRPAAMRRAAPCPYVDRCGGCNVQHLSHSDQLALKQRQLAEQLLRVAGTEPQAWASPLASPEFGYRRRARVAVRWDAKQQRLDVGFRAAASQNIVAIDHCLVLVQGLQQIFQELPGVLRQLSNPQAIGHVELFHGTAPAVLVRHTAPLGEADQALLRAFCARHEAQLWWQGASEPTADRPESELGYALAPWSLHLAYRPGDFVQVNEVVNQAMIQQALEWLAPQPGERILDLFCGLGNFALPIARQAGAVVGVEGVAGMVERAAGNAERNGLGNATFYQADLSQPLQDANWAAQGFSGVLLDPPRDGAFETTRHVSSLGARRIVYVSCNPATLARDTAELQRQGYRLKRAGVLDMFPQTAHVEAMALFEKGQDGQAM
ncbi:23S rRNA (uracil(1939)-C(5))-methyltransferase RlmD [Pseudomonas sp. RIT-PI-S]|uniref:23S rRNA (uracil(1939)-C(5))-methyltransferase RlmD n=1 Tax=Pseudomonas sp. RIT-PI-S TaxID=3035295 RepID=UPI0021DB735F|nr:23S rRNA (uracil(1939)-C(5))-methyltransferase RlmD [Pseudomonas sp. RIT-PI-S]